MTDTLAAPDEVVALLDEVRLLFHRAAATAESLHRPEGVTAGERALLESLHRAGPTSVSGIARRRHVTRQHVQTLVNGLLDRALVGASANPAHRRSPLISLTPAGSAAIERITARERTFLADLRPPVRSGDVTDARRTLATLRASIGGSHESA